MFVEMNQGKVRTNPTILIYVVLSFLCETLLRLRIILSSFEKSGKISDKEKIDF